MKTINKVTIPLFLAVMLLASCSGSWSAPTTIQTEVAETALSILGTMAVETRAAQSAPTASPTYNLTPTAIPGPYTVFPPNPDQQVYIDPDGWYAVNIPADMQPTDTPNYFLREGGFFETGYLPEMGYMSSALNVCTWLANIESEPEENSISWYSYYSPQPNLGCSVSTKEGDWDSIVYEIIENPAADPEHRFIYIITGRGYPWAEPIGITFSWLKPVYDLKPGPDLTPLSTEEAAFWENVSSMPSDISVTEYSLPPEAQAGPTEEILLGLVPEEALPDWATEQNTSISNKKPTVEEQLKSLGYELRGDITKGEGLQLFRNGRILFDHVTRVSNVYTFSTDSGLITAFIVNTIGTGGEFQHSFLIQNDVISVWDNSSMDPGFAPILYQGELLWAKVNQDSRVEIKKSNRGVIFTFETYFAASLPPIHLRAWNGHWILEVGDFLIQDGKILNTELGFQEIFGWSLVKDKPTYFFRKGPWIGLSYDGQILPVQYQDVAHGLCCGFAVNNPSIGSDAAYFFGKRDGIWYYVVVEFK